MARTATWKRPPRLPKPLPGPRGTRRTASYDDTRRWLWERLQDGDRGVANALYFWGNGPRPKGVIDLPRTLDEVAVQAAARWVRANRGPVANLVATRGR